MIIPSTVVNIVVFLNEIIRQQLNIRKILTVPFLMKNVKSARRKNKIN